jgi:hypothetical protein
MVLESIIPFISLIGFRSVSKPLTINGETAYQVEFFQSYSLTSSAVANDSTQDFSGCYSNFVLDVVYDSYFYPERQDINKQLLTYGITFKVDSDYAPRWHCKADYDIVDWLPDDGVLATTFFNGSSTVTGEGGLSVFAYDISFCLTPDSLHVNFHNSLEDHWENLPDTINRYWSLYDGSNNEMFPASAGLSLVHSMDFKAVDGFGYQSKVDKVGFTYFEALNAVKDRTAGSSYYDGFRKGFEKGKEEGKQEAEAEGSACAGSVDNVFSMFGKAFSAVADFFQMEVFGFLPLYWFFLAPIIAMIIAGIVKLV